jgi:uncharacterized 2Fe-2S/4Fe-4S cluster protein (DUF4445 family)
MLKKHTLMGAAIALALSAGSALAAVSPQEAAKLGASLTPFGAEKAGNAAGTGARIALLNRKARAEVEQTVSQIHKVETAIEPRFQEHFVNASNIPNAVEAFPNLFSILTLPDVNFNTGGGDTEGGRRRRRG